MPSFRDKSQGRCRLRGTLEMVLLIGAGWVRVKLDWKVPPESATTPEDFERLAQSLNSKLVPDAGRLAFSGTISK